MSFSTQSCRPSFLSAYEARMELWVENGRNVWSAGFDLIKLYVLQSYLKFLYFL